MKAWYCMMDGQQFGPFSSEQLRTLAQSGRLRPQDQVRQENGSCWTSAAKVRGLFPATNSEPVPPPALPVAIPMAVAPGFPTALPAGNPLAAPVTAPSHSAAAVAVFPAAEAEPRGVPRRRSKQRSYVVAAGMGAAVILFAAIGLIAFGTRSGQDAATVSNSAGEEPRSSRSSRSDPETDPEAIRSVTTNASLGVASREVDARLPAVPEIERWIEAGRQRRTLRNVMRLHVPNAWWSDGDAERRALIVEVEVENVSETRPLDYRGWNRSPANAGQAAILLAGEEVAIEAQPAAATGPAPAVGRLAPGERLIERLRFPLAHTHATPLRIVLPYAAVGQTGYVGFEIPRVLILAQSPEAEVAAKPDAPAAPNAPQPAREAPAAWGSAEPASIRELRMQIDAAQPTGLLQLPAADEPVATEFPSPQTSPPDAADETLDDLRRSIETGRERNDAAGAGEPASEPADETAEQPAGAPRQTPPTAADAADATD